MANWLTTADGKVRLIVLKAFHFNVPTVERIGTGERISSDTRSFKAAEHLLDPNDPNDAAVLNHPWINTHLADGHIEAPEATVLRQEAEDAKAAALLAQHAALRAEANQELERATAASQSQSATEDEIQEEMNTPVNQLRLGAKRKAAAKDDAS